MSADPSVDTEAVRRSSLRPPALVLAATVAMALVGGMWSVLTPSGEGPDEAAHLGLVLHLADGAGYPEHDGLPHDERTIEMCTTFAASTRWCRTEAETAAGVAVRAHPADDAPARSGRPRWGETDPRPSDTRINQMPQHPPAAYLLLSSVVEVERALTGSTWSTDRELALLRMVGVLTLAPLPLLAWWTARRAGWGDQIGSLAAVSLLAIPQLTATAGVLTSDNLFTLLAAASAALVAGVARGDLRVRTGLALGALCGLAFLTKAFAVVLPPTIVLAYVVGALTHRRREPGRGPVQGWASAAPAALASGLVTFGVGAWWYASRRAATGSFTPSVEDAYLETLARPPGFEAEVGRFASRAVTTVPPRFWGALGWFTVQLPAPIVVLLTAAGLALLLVGIRTAWRRGVPSTQPSDPGWAPPAPGISGAGGVVLVLLAPITLLLLVVLSRAWSLYADSGRFAFLQGRYLFGGIVGAVLLAAVGARRILGDRAAPIGSVVALVVQALVVLLAIEGWWQVGGASRTDALRGVLAWSPWPVGASIALLAAGPLALAGLVAVAHRVPARSAAPGA